MIDAGIRGIERFLEEYDQVSKAPQVGELAFLRRWKNEILTKPRGHLDESASAETTQPIDRIAGLHGEIKRAIQEERYEDASRLRDDLRRISAPPSDG